MKVSNKTIFAIDIFIIFFLGILFQMWVIVLLLTLGIYNYKLNLSLLSFFLLASVLYLGVRLIYNQSPAERMIDIYHNKKSIKHKSSD